MQFLFLSTLVATLGLLSFGVQPAQAQEYTVGPSSVQIYQERDGEQCGFMTGCSVAGEPVTFQLNDLRYSDGTAIDDNEQVTYRIEAQGSGCNDYPSPSGQLANLSGGNLNITLPANYVQTGCQYSVYIYDMVIDGIGSDDDDVRQFEYESRFSVPVQAACSADQCSEDLGMVATMLYELCDQLKNGTPQHAACMACFTGNGIWTAVGCIPSNPESIIKMVISVGLAVGGGIVLIMILVGSFMLSVSQGDPNKTKEAKEIITSAIIGLLFVIFSVTILQFIGVSVLRIPGFGE